MKLIKLFIAFVVLNLGVAQAVLEVTVVKKDENAFPIIVSHFELIQLGEYLLSNALEYQGGGEPISEESWQACLQSFKCDSKEDLYMKIGLSEAMVSVVLNKLQCDGNHCFLI